MSSTPRFGLPFFSAGHARKEALVNEALQTVDVVIGAAVEEPPRSEPPVSSQVGATYVVAASPSGDWAGKELCLAALTTGGWRVETPREGLIALDKMSGSHLDLSRRRVGGRRYSGRERGHRRGAGDRLEGRGNRRS